MKHITSLLIALSISSLVACQKTQDSKPVTAHHKTSSEMQQRSPGKPLGPVTVNYRLVETPALNMPLHIELTMRTAISGISIKVNYRLDNGLTSSDATTEKTFQPITPEQSYSHVINVFPVADGQHQVIVDVTLITNDGQEQSSTIAIPVTIGDVSTTQKPQHPNAGFLRQNDQTQPVIELPASEPPR